MSADRHRRSRLASAFRPFSSKNAVNLPLPADHAWHPECSVGVGVFVDSHTGSVMSKSTTAAVDSVGDQYDRLLSRFATSGFPPLIIAIGLRDQLLDALDRHHAASRILAVEPVPADTHDAMRRPTWRSWMEAERLTVLVGPDYKGYADAWRLITKDALQPPMLVDPELLQKFPSQTEAAKAVAKQIVRGARANEEARRRFAGSYLLNALRNLPVIAAEADASALCDAFTE